MIDKPKVSVVLATYNGADFLAEQLQSILSQSHPLYEVVVVDDCSTDATPHILAEWARTNPVVKWHQNERNLGYNKNFEKALLLATGDVLAIADQDDIWHPQKIERLLQNWPAGSPLIYSDSVMFLGQVGPNPKPGRWINRLAGKDTRQLALFNTIPGHAMLIRKHLLRLAAPFNPHVYYDWWLAVVAMANGGVTYHPEVLVYQRTHPLNASLRPENSRQQTFTREMNETVRHLEQFCKTPNLSEEESRFFETLYGLWRAVMKGKRRTALFLFLMKYRNIVYSSKKRKLVIVSQLKRSLRCAFRKL